MTDIEHSLRIYTGGFVLVRKYNGETAYGKLLWVEYDKEKFEFYVVLLFEEQTICIYESEIETVIPDYRDQNSAIINSVREALSKNYLLWDNGVITDRVGLFPVVDLVNIGSAVKVNYCNDLSAEDVEFSEVFTTPSVDEIVLSIDQNFKKYAPKKGLFKFWHKKKR